MVDNDTSSILSKGLGLSNLDWAIFCGVLFITIAFIIIGQAFFLKRKARISSSLDYLLMGRTLTLPLFVITLVTSWYGGIFGVTQIAYSEGIYNFITQGFVWYLAYIFFAFVIAEKINKSKVLSMSDKIRQIYGLRSGRLAAFLILLKGLPVAYAIGIGLVLKNIFGFDLNTGIATGCCFVVCYCSLGGLRAVVLSEIVQFTVMFMAVISVMVFSYFKFGGIDFLQNNLPASYFSVQGNRHFSEVVIWLFIAFASTIVCPIFYQRCLAAASPKVARRGILISTFFWFIFDVCTTFGSMYAKAAMPELDPVDAYLVYAVDILPVGFKGLFLAGVVATVLSTLDAFTFATGTIISYDLMPTKLRDYQSIRLLSIIAIGILTMGIAFVFEGKVEDVWLTVEGYSGALLAVPILWGYFVKSKGSEMQFFVATITSLTVMAIYDCFDHHYQIRSFYIGSSVNFLILMFFYLFNRHSNLISRIFK